MLSQQKISALHSCLTLARPPDLQISLAIGMSHSKTELDLLQSEGLLLASAWDKLLRGAAK